MSGVLPEYRGWWEPSIAREVTEGQGLTVRFGLALSGGWDTVNLIGDAGSRAELTSSRRPVGRGTATVLGHWQSQSFRCYDERRRRIAERKSCLAESFLVSQPEPDARIKYVSRGHPCPQNLTTSKQSVRPMHRPRARSQFRVGTSHQCPRKRKLITRLLPSAWPRS